MNEYILVQFAVDRNDVDAVKNLLDELGDDFVLIGSAIDVEAHLIVSGKISSATAIVIKLSNTLLSESMRVSYIPDTLKNKYRR